MNKLKLMYDVVTTMKDKEVFNGTLQLTGNHGGVKVVDFWNEFEKNTATGQVKTKIRAELNHDGKQVKHESCTEFTNPCCDHKFHSFEMHCHHFARQPHGHLNWHQHGHPHGQMHGDPNGHHEGHHHPHANLHMHLVSGGGCFKDKWNKLAFILKTLNDIEIEEKEDGCTLALSLNDLPEHLHECCKEKMAAQVLLKPDEHHQQMAKLLCMENPQIMLKLHINCNHEIEKVLLDITGQTKCDSLEVESETDGNSGEQAENQCESEELQDIAVSLELNLLW